MPLKLIPRLDTWRFADRMGLFALLAVAVNVTSVIVLNLNFSAGVYPTDGDIIAIPIFQNFAFTALIAIFITPLFGLATARWVYAKSAASPLWRYPLIAILYSWYLWVILLMAAWGWDWFIPHHYSMAMFALPACLATAAFACADVRRLLMRRTPIDQ